MTISNRKLLGSLPRVAYEAIDGLTQSELSYLLKSPLHFEKRRELGRETDAMRLGTAIHAAILEPELFKDKLVVEPEHFNGEEINRRVKKHRDYLADWRQESENLGKIILKNSEYDILIGILAQASRTPTLKELLRGGTPEVAATWEQHGVPCKGRADYCVQHPTLGKCIVDIKTTQDGSASAFSRSIYNYAYDLQAAWYLNGFGADEFIFVVCEKTPPYPIAVYRADPSLLGRGAECADRLLKRMIECKSTGSWPGYTQDISTILLPSWVAAQENSGEIRGD